MTNKYIEHYKVFDENVAFAARTWHQYVYIRNKAAEDSAFYDALNKASRFWNDYYYSAVQTTIIFLGKIFDFSTNSHNIDKTIEAAGSATEHFSREELRKRKIESAGNFESLDEYIANAVELGEDDIKAIEFKKEEAKAIWKRIKPLRDKIYAHHEVMSDSKREELYKAVKNEDMDNILQILLNISYALEQAELNGKKPDFSENSTRHIKWAQKSATDLVQSLLPV